MTLSETGCHARRRASSELYVSVVVPCFNEEANVQPLLGRLVPVLKEVSTRFEIIFVDDGSSDETVERVLGARKEDRRVKLVQLSRNFGKETALSAGMEHARGDVVISMDADLQHSPELIPNLLGKWREGYEVVIAVRDETEDAGWAKRTSSRVFYRLLNILTGLRLPQGTTDFRLLGRRALQALCACGDQDRFSPRDGSLGWVWSDICALRRRGAPRRTHQVRLGKTARASS